MDTKKVKESVELLRKELQQEPRHQKALGHLKDAAEAIWNVATPPEQQTLKGEDERHA